jgi:pimeloyl-ACP methyl ester carboxylesterase
MIVAGSILGGFLAAVLLVLGPFAGARESEITGAILIGFGFGWAMLAVLSARVEGQARPWAAAMATAMGVTGLALVIVEPDTAALTALGWVWPVLLLGLVVWAAAQVRGEPAGRGRWLLYPVFGTLALVSVGGAYETLRNATDSGIPSAAGERLISVGTHRLSIRCTGAGSPTVVLEPGLGESATAMARWIGPDVAGTTRICVYDHAGHGRSDAAPGNKADAALDLHVLLQRAHIPGPYVIAGHSLGGMFALDFARRFPNEVAGVVLLDSMHPKQANAFAGKNSLLAVLPTLARTGVARLLADPADGPPMAQTRQFVRDVEGMPTEQDRAAKLRTLGDRPLGVITAGRGYDSAWLGEQADLATLSRNALHRQIAGATHASLIDDQGDAAQSSRAIRQVVIAVRTSRPLRELRGS